MGLQGSVNEWRKRNLDDLMDLKKDDDLFNKVIWISAGDANVCPLCAARNGKYYSFEEAKRELDGEFCKPSDPDDRCRCTFIMDDSCLK